MRALSYIGAEKIQYKFKIDPSKIASFLPKFIFIEKKKINLILSRLLNKDIHNNRFLLCRNVQALIKNKLKMRNAAYVLIFYTHIIRT